MQTFAVLTALLSLTAAVIAQPLEARTTCSSGDDCTYGQWCDPQSGWTCQSTRGCVASGQTGLTPKDCCSNAQKPGTIICA
ncbi:hypothetical protein LZ30DRAFT_128372 [Colletotrichum cereale]|nr:hypothetical protein LZ30DRAFT_128372 [Colletotrichum cereale]